MSVVTVYIKFNVDLHTITAAAAAVFSMTMFGGKSHRQALEFFLEKQKKNNLNLKRKFYWHQQNNRLHVIQYALEAACVACWVTARFDFVNIWSGNFCRVTSPYQPYTDCCL